MIILLKDIFYREQKPIGLDTDDGFYGMVFQDSDAAKWLEAVAYSLAVFPDEETEKIAPDWDERSFKVPKVM